jgi:hypothetical protein
MQACRSASVLLVARAPVTQEVRGSSRQVGTFCTFSIFLLLSKVFWSLACTVYLSTGYLSACGTAPLAVYPNPSPQSHSYQRDLAESGEDQSEELEVGGSIPALAEALAHELRPGRVLWTLLTSERCFGPLRNPAFFPSALFYKFLFSVVEVWRSLGYAQNKLLYTE